MGITQIAPGDSTAMESWYDLRLAVAQHDLPDCAVPSRREHVTRFEYLSPSVVEEALLAWDGDQIVGAASYQLPQAENLRMVYLDLIVHPQYRRRGIGTRLLEEVYATARRHGRRLVEVHTVRALPSGIARDEAGYKYLTNRAHRPGATDVRSRCQLTDHAANAEATLAEAWTHADGYSLVQWRDAVSEDLIEDVAALQSRLMLDAPTGNLSVDQQLYDASRVRHQEASELGRATTGTRPPPGTTPPAGSSPAPSCPSRRTTTPTPANAPPSSNPPTAATASA